MNSYQSQIQGSYFHVYNRALSGSLIFTDEGSYSYFLRLLKENLNKYELALISYCLMPNHFHLLVQLHKEFSLTLFIRRLLNTYVQGHNHHLNRRGPLFEGRTKYKLIQDETYLLQVCRYIHLNPVKANLVREPQCWHYSNYLEWIGQREGNLIDKEFVGRYYPNQKNYQEFVADGYNCDHILGVEQYFFD